jgi:hypothetical protein
MKKLKRRQRGNILFITLLLSACVVMPLLMVLGQMGLYVVDRQRLQNTIEAACLLAANDMSRIMINDPNFGYVSLSNYPPTGKATLAPDGDPLPVTGINTLIGTLRQNAIVAGQIGNRSMGMLIDADRRNLQFTIGKLNSALTDALNSDGHCTDIDGEEVDPVADVTAFLTANLPDNMELKSVHLSNGWLSGGGTTTIPIPQPRRFAVLQEEDFQDGNYKAFIDMPLAGASFTFAGVGSSSTLVSPTEFQEADNEHICSIIKLQCTIAMKDGPKMPLDLHLSPESDFIACCQPYTLPDSATKGIMTLKFPSGTVPGLQSWNDLLASASFNDNQVTAYDVVGGDYPVDPDARVQQIPTELQTTTAHLFAEHLYHWLRNGHVRPRVDAILKMVREPFQCGPKEFYAYEFADNGTVSRKVLSGDPFPVGVIADAQSSVVADTNIGGGVTPIIVFRNNVKHLGTKDGGKHGGQPLAGYPLDWSDLEERSGDQQQARRLGRRSLYRRGLALDIEVGGIREHTASLDVESKSGILRSRKI